MSRGGRESLRGGDVSSPACTVSIKRPSDLQHEAGTKFILASNWSTQVLPKLSCVGITVHCSVSERTEAQSRRIPSVGTRLLASQELIGKIKYMLKLQQISTHVVFCQHCELCV